MQADYDIFGIESFHFEVISTYATVEEANKAEEVLLAANVGNSDCYNISPLASPCHGLGPNNPSWNKPMSQDCKDKKTATADAKRAVRIAYKIANNIPLNRNDKMTPKQRAANKQISLKSSAKQHEKRHTERVLRASALTPVIPLMPSP